MTVLGWIRVMMRQWRAAVLGLALTITAALIGTSGRTVYWTDVAVRFAAPSGYFAGIYSNTLVSSTESIIAVAGLVALQANGEPTGPRFSSDSVSIVDAGVAQGRLIRLSNAGGQWANNYDQPTLNVQVAGSEPDQVRAYTRSTLAELAFILASKQDQLGVPPEARITLLPDSEDPAVRAAHGSRWRAFAAVILLGVGTTVAAAMYLDFWLLRQHGGRHSSVDHRERRV